jgi:hypothetical protein
MGTVAHECEKSEKFQISRLLRKEICARTLKSLLRSILRDKMKEIMIPVEQPYIKKTVKFFNGIFQENQEKRIQFWLENVKPLLIKKFPKSFFDGQVEDEKFFWEMSSEDLDDIFLRVQKLSGVELTNPTKRRTPLFFSDVVRMGVVRIFRLCDSDRR